MADKGRKIRYVSAQTLIATERALKIQRRKNPKGFKWPVFALVIHAAGHNPVKYYVIFKTREAALSAGQELASYLRECADDDDLYNAEIERYLKAVGQLLDSVKGEELNDTATGV